MSTEITLKVIYEDKEENILSANGGAVSLGRHSENTVVIYSESVSRKHGIIQNFDEYWFYCDLGSTNGSFLNNIPIRAGNHKLLRNNDQLRLANFAVGVSFDNQYNTKTEQSGLFVFKGETFIGKFELADGEILGLDKLPISRISGTNEQGYEILLTNLNNRFLVSLIQSDKLVTINGTAIRKDTKLRDGDELTWDDYRVSVVDPRANIGDSVTDLPRFEFNEIEQDLLESDLSEIIDGPLDFTINPDDTVIVKTVEESQGLFGFLKNNLSEQQKNKQKKTTAAFKTIAENK